jgi:hypothetical protein
VSAPLFPTPWMYGRRKLTRAETAVYAGVIAVLIVVFTSYVLDFMEMAEKAAMETTVSTVTSALNVHYARRVMAGEAVDARRWLAGNPFELARAFPAGYMGELDGRDPSTFDRPAWFFDTARREVLYLPRLRRHLSSPFGSEVRFQLARRPSGLGFVLAPTSPYEWGLTSSAKDSQSSCETNRICLFS